MILFATPVYWWGMSAQLKLIIDKCYCRGLQLKNKKVGTIVVGGSPVDSIQYELIDKQFDCMAKYLSWDMLFKKSYYATARDELEKNKDSMNELEGIGKNFKARSKFKFCANESRNAVTIFSVQHILPTTFLGEPMTSILLLRGTWSAW